MDPENSNVGDPPADPPGPAVGASGATPDPGPAPRAEYRLTKFFRSRLAEVAVWVVGIAYALLVLGLTFGAPESFADARVRWGLWLAGLIEVGAVVFVWWPALIDLLVRLWLGVPGWVRSHAPGRGAVIAVAVAAVLVAALWLFVSTGVGKLAVLAAVVGLALWYHGRAVGQGVLDVARLIGPWFVKGFRPWRLVCDFGAWLWVRDGWLRRLEGALVWVLSSSLFPLQIGLFWAISLFNFGSGLGMPDLVWGDEWYVRLWVGVSVSMLFANVLFVRAMLDTQSGGKPPFDTEAWSLFGFAGDAAVRRMGAFLSRTWLPALLVFYLPPALRGQDWARTGDGYPGMMLLGLIVGVVLTVVLVAWYELRWSAGWQKNADFRALPGFREEIPEEDRPLHALAAVFAIPSAGFAAVFLFEYIAFNAVWSPVWVVGLMLGLFNLAYGFVSFHFAGLKYVLLTLVLLIVLVSNTNHPYKMSHPGLQDYAANPVKLQRDKDDPPLPMPEWRIQTSTLLKHFHEQKWADPNGKKRAGKPKLVVVCTTGGGIQAAVWTALVLEALEGDPELKQHGFRNHIRLMTGASGGMQGAALYAADFDNPHRGTDEDTPHSRQLARDSLWPTVQTMAVHDFLGSIAPWPFRHDRGRRLEDAWRWNCRHWKRADGSRADDPPTAVSSLFTSHGSEWPPLNKTFGQLIGGERTCDRPTLVFSPMFVEDCRRVLITNLAVDWFTTTTASNLNPPPPGSSRSDAISVPAIEFWRYFSDAHNPRVPSEPDSPEFKNIFTVGTAARMSASFPFVGPAVSLPTVPPRRVVDAGYFDNFGINFAAMWLHHHKQAIIDHTSGVVIIEIRAYPRREEKLNFVLKNDKGEPIGETVNWVASEGSSPLEAVYNLYARSAYFRNDQLLHILHESFNKERTADGQPFFTTVTFECNQPAALSWTLPRIDFKELRALFTNDDLQAELPHLTDTQREAVRESRKKLKGAIDNLQKWFGTGGK